MEAAKAFEIPVPFAVHSVTSLKAVFIITAGELHI
jgi:hypothetical protein